MKVGRIGAGSTGRVGGSRRTSSGGGSESFRVSGATTPEAPAPLSGASGLAPVSALLAIQETGDATSERQRGLKRGADLLGRLERIRLALIDGHLPPAQLQGLARALSQRDQGFSDPRLREILEEIELRAAVELAKLEMSAGRHDDAA